MEHFYEKQCNLYHKALMNSEIRTKTDDLNIVLVKFENSFWDRSEDYRSHMDIYKTINKDWRGMYKTYKSSARWKPFLKMFNDFYNELGISYCLYCTKGDINLEPHHIVYNWFRLFYIIECPNGKYILRIIPLCRDCHQFISDCLPTPKKDFYRVIKKNFPLYGVVAPF